MLTRDLFPVVNLLVEFYYASQNHQLNSTSIIQHNSYSVRALRRTLLVELTTLLRLRSRLKMGTPFPLVHPSTPSVSRSRRLAFKPLHLSVPLFLFTK